MARRMPKGLELWKPAYGQVNFHGVPMYRCLAWALLDYELHGGHLIVNSADRRDSVIQAFNRKYGTHLRSQWELWEGWKARKPGFFPANKPGTSSHELISDGNPFYGPANRALPRYMLGIDAVQRPGGDAADVVRWLNLCGYEAARPYATVSERHHFSFAKSPARNARKRLHSLKEDQEVAMRLSDKGLRRIAKFEGFVAHPYKPVTGEKHWTWGYGHYGPDVPAPKIVHGRHTVTISQERALALLRKDISRFEAGVSALLKTRVNQNRFDALVSLAFNIGLTNFANSTVLRETNKRHFLKAAAAFRFWNKGGVPLRVLPGLVIRRSREARVFLTPVKRR